MHKLLRSIHISTSRNILHKCPDFFLKSEPYEQHAFTVLQFSPITLILYSTIIANAHFQLHWIFGVVWGKVDTIISLIFQQVWKSTSIKLNIHMNTQSFGNEFIFSSQLSVASKLIWNWVNKSNVVFWLLSLFGLS